MKALNLKKNDKGFTLVELIIVIAIIGILAAIAVPRLQQFGKSAEDRRVLTEHRMLVGGVQMWQSEQEDPASSFPESLADIAGFVDGGVDELYDGAHSIADGKLVSTEPNSGNTHTYPKSGD